MTDDARGQDRRGRGGPSGPRSGGSRSGGPRSSGGPQGRAGGERRSDPRDGGRDGVRRPDDKGGKGGKPGRGGPRGADSRGATGKDGRSWSRDRADRGQDRQPRERTVDQKTYDGPELPEEITGKELDPSIRTQLKGLPEKLAARVARHLAAAGASIDDDPELAWRHAQAAKARAPRLAVVREAAGESAYAAGHYAEALAELRAAKRMNGATAYLPIMADCHRALGQPDQALKLAHSQAVANFAPEAKAEMTIVEAGARRDQGQVDAALRVLERAPLHSKSRASWVVRLRYAYADALEAAGQPTEALAWFHRTHAIDSDEITDAAERAAALERTASS